ncbi:IucA/IucC family protein [Saccharopolyspora taberi]|uniref:Petrobactin biosynthesis protein AsbB n=1 Tax=Saccharopolyspora taberi TaxID=60895 RepID=A0ABN3V2X3_9PSEU
MTTVQDALRHPRFALVRRRVFRQLLESLLYEEVLEPRVSGDHHVLTGTDAHGRAVTYEFTAARRYGFERVRLGPEPVSRTVGGVTAEADSLRHFVFDLREQLGADDRLTGFARELEATLIKDAMAQHARFQRADVLAGADFDALECLITDGHPYHPAYKSRLGFDFEDNLRWGPEFARPLRVLWLAAHHGIATVSTSESLPASFVADQLGPGPVEAFQQVIRQHGHAPEDYALVPVHPWQWREVLSEVMADELRSGELIVLGEDAAPLRPQQSIRTLSYVDSDRAYLKLSLSIVNTSTSRVLAPHTVANAPRISDWLKRIVAGDPYLNDTHRLVVLGEVAATSVEPREESGPESYGALACIWRDNLKPRLSAEERAVPFNGLISRELDGTPLIDPWVRAHGVEQWVRDLLSVTLPPLVHLLQGHGVALESHAQNMALIHVGGRPARLALRDFHDGVRFSRARLARPELCPELAGTPAHHVNRNSFVETDDLDLVVDYLLDALLFINLGELSLFLADSYGFDEREFWSIARRTVHDYQRRFPELEQRFAEFDVFKPGIGIEKLTTRRLLPDTELRLHVKPNPLADAKED